MKSAIMAIITCMMLLSTTCLGQTEPSFGAEVSHAEFQAKQVISPAPEAAELGKYGNVPISLFTGTPSISIPLYELKGNEISLPISLSYNASGFKPEEQATWVGAGWSLNAGGVVTRAVMGNPDNESNYFGVPDILDPPFRENLLDYLSYAKDLSDGIKEAQPDVYYYNFAGHSGRFMLRPDYSVFKKEDDLTIITPCIGSSGCPTSKFTIVDEKGFSYVFESSEMTKMIPNDGSTNPGPPYNYVSSWYLTSISAPSGSESVTFDYYTTDYQLVNLGVKNNQSVYVQDGQNACGRKHTFEESYSYPPSIYIKRCYLKKVTLKRMDTVISYIEVKSLPGVRQDSTSSEDRMLQQLKMYSVVSGTAKLIKQYDFTQSYFSNPGNPSYKSRLRLDALQEKGSDSVTEVRPPYQFTYNTDGDMPERYTYSIDHWGFFNNAQNTTLAPSVPYQGPPDEGQITVGLGSNREPSLSGSSYTLLNKIQYPAGGYTTFEYELNRAENYRPVGGVRIARMVDNSFSDKQAVITQYSYTRDDGSSSGQAGTPEYAVLGSYQQFFVPHFGVDCTKDPYIINTITVSANSIFGLGSVQGSHIGYSQVIESRTSLTSGRSLGKTVYKYNVLLKELDDDVSNGDLTEKDVYDGSGKLLESTSNSYIYSVLDFLQGCEAKPESAQTNHDMYCKTNLTPATYFNYGNWETPDASCMTIKKFVTRDYLYHYNIQSQRKLLTSKVTKQFDQLSNSYITTTTNYSYDAAGLNYPTKIQQATSDDEQVVTEKKYAGQFTVTSPVGDNAIGIKNLQQKNILAAEIESVQYRQNADGTNKRYINGQITTYHPAWPLPSSILRMEAAGSLPSLQSSSISNGTFIYDSHYKLAGSFTYGVSGNLISQSKAKDVVTSYIWGYNTSLPVAAVFNSEATSTVYTGFEKTGTSADWQQYQTTTNTSMALTGTQSCNLTGSSKISKLFVQAPIQQLKVSYWSINGALTVTVNTIINAPLSMQGDTHNGWTYYEHILPAGTYMVELTSTSARTIDELRLLPVAAQMVTYTYDPLIGKTSECSTNNTLTFYEYDVAGRLIHIRDGNRDIVKSFVYHYNNEATGIANDEQTLFYNEEIENTFINTCTNGGTPKPVIYKVPYGKYVALSQAAANNKATADVAANGQAYADQNGTCFFYNVLYKRKLLRNNCLPEQGLGHFYTYTVPAGTYGAVTQAAADALAAADADSNAQEQANENGTCSCGSEGQMFINGNCETGTRYYISSVQEGSQWQCSYYYLFSNGATSSYYSGYFSSPCSIEIVP